MIKPFFTVLCCAIFGCSAYGQSFDMKSAFIEKWDNSKGYLIEVARAMPQDQYQFKPTVKQMTFEEQLRHIHSNITWLGSSYFDTKSVKLKDDLSKDELIAALENSFEVVATAAQNTPVNDLKTEVSFFAGPKSKLQILNLLQDHVTHHRGQLIVYLNLCEVTPPAYSGW